MIDSLHIADTATYGATPQILDRLAKLNFFFGSNGAGKTTITRVVENPSLFPKCGVSWKNGTPLQTLVYNRDFVARNFSTSAKLKGIFTLGEADIEKLATIAAKKAEFDVSTAKIEGLSNTLQGADQKSGKRGELTTLESNLQDKCWAQKKKHDGAFSAAFEGFRASADKFKAKVLMELASNAAATQTLGYLTDKAKTVFGPTPSIELAVVGLSVEDIIVHESNPILSKRVIGKEDVNIAQMIQRLGNSDWVKQGKAFYKESAPACPFCQQEVFDGFEESLASYFDETFEKDTTAIESLEAAYARDSKSILLWLQAISDPPSRFLDLDMFAAEKSAIESKIAANTLIIATKKKEPSQAVELESLSDALSSVGKLILDANAAVATHNEISRNIAKERRDLTAQVWKYVLEAELKAELASFSGKKAGINAAISKLTTQIQEATTAKANLDNQIKALEKTTTSVQPTIDGINDLLQSFGFRSFSLAMADGGAFYTLVRQDGSDAKETLSEGEKSFVTFLYFYHLLKGSESESGMTVNRVVVFDDPVSSLDSDILFIVSSLIKALFEEIRADSGHIKQIFVLTHNVYFHKEVTYTTSRGDDKKKDERSYWVVRKNDGGAVVERHPTNPIKTSYDLLWAELRSEKRSNLTIQNTLRRILEYYFKILGGVDFDAICEKFEGKEKVICKSLFSWVNDGSHYAHDDVFFTLDDAAIDAYLDIFKRVFIKTDHLRHYEMMMGVE